VPAAAAATHARAERNEAVQAERPPMRVLRTGTTGGVDFGSLPNRGGLRAGVAASTATAEPAPAPTGPQIDDYLDIPAFLRRQAD
ncbi:MAG TPA: hypothetical protein VFL14_02865, partial [Xanthomonadales bacterium]|nr:hypothetical protein [Xanthomonadales bacterium]